MRSLAGEIGAKGGMVALRHEVVGVAREGDGFVLQVRDADGAESEIEADLVVNSAGLGADKMAAMLGYGLDGDEATPRLRQGVNKGRYYDIVTPEKARGLRHLIYPVPQHRLGGLGVHLTLDIDGGAHLGPDTEWLEDGCVLDYRADDTRGEAFLESAKRFLPGLEREDIAPGQVGYRPKLQRPGEDMADFLIWHDRGLRAPGRDRVAGADVEPGDREACGGDGVKVGGIRGAGGRSPACGGHRREREGEGTPLALPVRGLPPPVPPLATAVPER